MLVILERESGAKLIYTYPCLSSEGSTFRPEQSYSIDLQRKGYIVQELIQLIGGATLCVFKKSGLSRV